MEQVPNPKTQQESKNSNAPISLIEYARERGSERLRASAAVNSLLRTIEVGVGAAEAGKLGAKIAVENAQRKYEELNDAYVRRFATVYDPEQHVLMTKHELLMAQVQKLYERAALVGAVHIVDPIRERVADVRKMWGVFSAIRSTISMAAQHYMEAKQAENARIDAETSSITNKNKYELGLKYIQEAMSGVSGVGNVDNVVALSQRRADTIAMQAKLRGEGFGVPHSAEQAA